jgi:hypothetical protein
MIVSKCCHADIYFVDGLDENDNVIHIAHCDKCNKKCQQLAINEKENKRFYHKIKKGI